MEIRIAYLIAFVIIRAIWMAIEICQMEGKCYNFCESFLKNTVTLIIIVKHDMADNDANNETYQKTKLVSKKARKNLMRV